MTVYAITMKSEVLQINDRIQSFPPSPQEKTLVAEPPSERGGGAEGTLQLRPIAPCKWRCARGEAVD